MAIDWNHWLKLYKPLNEEIIFLTLELNPDDIKIDHFMGERYIVNKENLLGELNLEYDRRMRLLRESRFRPFAYLENLNDGGWGNYFSADGNGTQVITTRFLLWLKNEDIAWSLPPELQTYIALMDKNQNSGGKKITPLKSVPIQVQQDKNVLDAIEVLGQKPLALPPQTKQGTRSFKADVKDYCISNHNFTSDTFNNTWKRLKENKKIKSGS